MSLSRPFHFLNVRGFATASTSRALSKKPQRHLSTAVSNPSRSKAWYRRTWQPQLPEKALPPPTKAGKRALHTTPVRLHGSITRPAPGTGIKVHFKDAKGNPIKTVEVNEGDDILSIAHEHDIDLEGACEGSVACSTCHVILSAEHYDRLPEPSDDENDMLDMAFGLTDTSRLGCQVQVTRELEGMDIGLPSATRNIRRILVVCEVAAEPTLSPYVLHERRSSIPSGWQSVSSYPQDAVLPLRFAIAQPNTDQLEALLHDVSSPDSPNYGAHWTPAQVAQKFASSRESLSIVFEWLTTSGFHPERIRTAPTRAWIELNATVTEAERLLRTQYRVFAHDNSGTEHVACDAYHVPEHVAPHLDFVTPTIHFNAVLPRSLDARSGSGTARNVGQPGVGIYPKTTGQIHDLFTDLKDCDKQITPVCLRALYGLVYEPLATSENSYGIVEYTPQAYVQSDLDMFAKNFSSGLVGKSPELVSIDGGVVQNTTRSFNVNGESNLDLQYGMALVTPRQPVTLYQVGDTVQGGSFNNLLDALDGTYCTFEGGDDPTQDGIYPDPAPGGYHGPASCGITKPAHVISTSYGYNEADLSPAYTARQCAEYAKLGLMGVTVLYSSGDNGVAGNGGYCLDPNGLQTPDGKLFNPSFPSTCPYVTSVGATQVNPGSKVTDPEGACEQVIFSGGGFSNYFKRPSWQDKSISNYMTEYGSKLGYPAGTFNATGTRGYPDLSANGANYVVAIDGEFSLVFGTSASSPVVGAILTMVNDARLFKGKQPIGFINPTIYSDEFAGAFNDITSGSNQGCGVSGFNAVEGWDPVTGLGTPSFPKLLAQWLLLP